MRSKGCLVLVFLTGGLALAAGPCVPVPRQVLVAKPLPYPKNEDPSVLAYAAMTGDTAVDVLLPANQAASPQAVTVRVFVRGKHVETRELWLGGQLRVAREVDSTAGGRIAVSISSVAVSADGSVVALQGFDRVLIFRGEELRLSVPGVFPWDSVALTEDTFFFAPLVESPEKRLLYAHPLEGEGKPSPILEPDTHDMKTHQLKLAVRSDQKLWAVDAFTLKAWLLSRAGAVQRRYAPPDFLDEPPDVTEENFRALEAYRAQAMGDATRKPPRVELRPASRREQVQALTSVGTKAVLIRNSPHEEEKKVRLLVLNESSGTWRCLLVPASGDGATLRGTSAGVFLVSPHETFFLPAELLEGDQPQRGEGARGGSF